MIRWYLRSRFETLFGWQLRVQSWLRQFAQDGTEQSSSEHDL